MANPIDGNNFKREGHLFSENEEKCRLHTSQQDAKAYEITQKIFSFDRKGSTTDSKNAYLHLEKNSTTLTNFSNMKKSKTTLKELSELG